MGVSIKITGAKALAQDLKYLAAGGPVVKIVKLNGTELQQKAMRNCPVDTGTLRRSIDLKFTSDGLTAKVEAHTDYAAYVEYGTRFMLARPYLGHAYNAQLPQFYSDLARIGLRR